MKFSTKDRYALLLMVELASATPGEYLPLKAVSDNQGISVKYLEQIVAPLSKAGLVESGRGSETLGFWEGLNQVINQYNDSATLEKLSSEYLSH